MLPIYREDFITESERRDRDSDSESGSLDLSYSGSGGEDSESSASAEGGGGARMLTIPLLGDFLGKLKPALYDDVADRLNYYATPLLLIFFTFCVMGKQYIGSPIQCFIPAEFKGGWEQYAEDYCFIQNTYYVPLHMDIPNDVEKREEKEIGYYQWIPVVLALQALLFYLPFFFWKTAAWQTGINVEAILSKAQKLQEGEDKVTDFRRLAQQMEADLGCDRGGPLRYRRFLCLRLSRGNLGSYCTALYLAMKLLNTANVGLQFWIMNQFLGTGYRFWGAEVLADLVRGREWHDSGHFPRVTLCDFAVRRLGQIQKYSIQCVLMLNMFNEKIYIFLWFWMLVVGIITVLNLFYWLWTTLFPAARYSHVSRYLRLSRGFDERDGKALRGQVGRFAENWLRVDGLLLLRFIGAHNGDSVSADLCSQLWEDFLAASERRRPYGGHPTLQMVDGYKGDRSNSTKSSSGGDDDGFAEDLYDPPPKKNGEHPLLASAPPASAPRHGYPGPPQMPPPKAGVDVV